MSKLDATTARSIADYPISQLAKWCRRIRREQARRAQGEFVSRPASKDSKHNAYGDANQIIRTLRLDIARPNSVDDLEAVLAAASRWTPEQYDAAEDAANKESAGHIAAGLRQSAKALRDYGFTMAADDIERAANQLTSDIENA